MTSLRSQKREGQDGSGSNVQEFHDLSEWVEMEGGKRLWKVRLYMQEKAKCQNHNFYNHVTQLKKFAFMQSMSEFIHDGGFCSTPLNE